jgi:hypothetical protein
VKEGATSFDEGDETSKMRMHGGKIRGAYKETGTRKQGARVGRRPTDEE